MADAVTIGIVSPGAMGSALGRAWRSGGAHVVTTAAGRSARTRSLADGLTLLPGIRAVVAASDVVVSIGPPAAATAMAADIAAACRAAECQPLVADLNAIAPSTVGQVAAILADAGCELLDGAISGGPPQPGGDSTLYLAGTSAYRLADRAAPGLRTLVVGAEPGLASAVKMCTASVYKGFSGLLTQALQTAYFYGVTDVVLADLQEGFGERLAAPAVTLAMAVSKSDRFPGEMLQIAAAQATAGAEPALFEAMAAVFTALARTPLARHSPEAAAAMTDLDTVLADLA